MQPTGAQLSEYLRRTTQKQHGTAFREYMTHLVNDLNTDESGLHDRLNVYIKNFMADAVPPGADGQVYRVASRFALVAAGGELATHYGVTGWPEGEAHWGALTCFNAWLDRRGGIGQAEITKLLDQVEQFFELHGDSRFVPMDGDYKANHRPVINRAGFRRAVSVAASDETRTEYFVLPSAFREICNGFDHRWAARQLAEKGIIRGSNGKNSIMARLPGMGLARVYHFPCHQEEILKTETAPF